MARLARRDEARTVQGAPGHLPPGPFDSLVRQLVFYATPKRGTIIGVTSAIDAEGKTTAAAELALRLSQWADQARPVLLVVCAGEVAMGRPIVETPATGRRFKIGSALVYCTLSTLEARGIPLRDATLPETFDQLRGQHTFVVLDLPSLLSEPIAAELARAVDRLYLVVRAGATSVELVRQALGFVDTDRIDGVILNEARPGLPGWLSRLVR